MKLGSMIGFSCLGTALSSIDAPKIIEHFGISMAFGTMLFFVLQQFKRLMDELIHFQTRVVQVVEKNTEANNDLRRSFDQLKTTLKS